MPAPNSLLSSLLPFLHVGQVAMGAWAGKHSYEAIRRLRQYEDATKKAAKYSSTADNELQRTRTTQAAGAITVCTAFQPVLRFLANSNCSQILISTLSSLYLVYDHSTRSKTTHWAAYIVIYVLNIAGPLAARTHIAPFWKSKAKVPFVQGYNEAIDETKLVWAQLQWIQWSWVGVGVMELALG